MNFWDILQIAVFVIFGVYLVIQGVKMMSGKQVIIPLYSNMVPADQACYDEQKIRQYMGMGHIASAVALIVFLLGQFSGNDGLALVGVIVLLGGYALPHHLLKRTDFFIKK